MNESRPIKVSFSFYPADMAALGTRVNELNETGIKAREATVLRALIHLGAPDAMFSSAVKLTASEALSAQAEDAPNVSGHPTIDAELADIAKLDGVLERLAKAGITQSRSFVIRAMLNSAPRGRELVALMKRFREAVPNKPRGLSKLRLAAKRQSRG